MRKRKKTIWIELKKWFLKRARNFLMKIKMKVKKYYVKNGNLARIKKYYLKNKKLLKKRKRVCLGMASLRMFLLIRLVKKKIKITEREHKRYGEKLNDLYKKELKFLSRRIHSGTSFFNKQKKNNKKIQKKYLFLFKKQKKKIFRKINKKIKKINYFLTKYKKLIIKIINN